MRQLSWIRCAALCGIFALMAPYTAAVAQEVQSFTDIIMGKTIPLSMKPKDMPADYKAMRIKVAGAGGGGLMDMMGALMSPFMMMAGGSSNSDPQGSMLMTLADVNWTKGDIVKVQNKDFLVTYKWNIDISQMAAQDKNKDPEVAKNDAIKGMELSLSLLAIDGITSISPVIGFTKEDLVKLIETPYVKPPTSVPEDPPTSTIEEATSAAPDDDVKRTLANAKQVGTAMVIYTADYDDVLPYAQSTKAVQYVTSPYVKNLEVWKTFNPSGSQFLYNISIGGSSLSVVESLAETVMFYESRAWPDGRRVVTFADSHAALVTAEEWLNYERTLRLKLPKIAKPLPLNYGMDWHPGK